MWQGSRRKFLGATGAILGHSYLTRGIAEHDVHPQEGVTVLHPADRVPLSFVIDDSTCLVNMGHFCTPQFAAAFPDREEYKRPWQEWPREIPDSFVREFGEWCATKGVKGKYSIVPYPACVGWLDRELPGWSRPALESSLQLVRDLMVPNWDIHPEMITHTRVINIKTGRPYPEIGPATIENSFPRQKKSVDELAEYLAYALQILKNCGLPCEGITTPGGFGNVMKSELSLAVQQSVRDVFSSEVPHYFKYVHTGDETTEPVLEHVSGRGTSGLNLTVNVPAGTGDWFGGWQGVNPTQGMRYSNDDATQGRMVELIEQGRPAVMLCHWPGLYNNGTKDGFRDFQRVVTALERRFRDRTVWMKLSEMARYWAAKQLTDFRASKDGIGIEAPIAAPQFTIRFNSEAVRTPVYSFNGMKQSLRRVDQPHQLEEGTWRTQGREVTICFGLQKGASQIEWSDA